MKALLLFFVSTLNFTLCCTVKCSAAILIAALVRIKNVVVVETSKSPSRLVVYSKLKVEILSTDTMSKFDFSSENFEVHQENFNDRAYQQITLCLTISTASLSVTNTASSIGAPFKFIVTRPCPIPV